MGTAGLQPDNDSRSQVAASKNCTLRFLCRRVPSRRSPRATGSARLPTTSVAVAFVCLGSPIAIVSPRRAPRRRPRHLREAHDDSDR
jgi:hypothetical protein